MSEMDKNTNTNTNSGPRLAHGTVCVPSMEDALALYEGQFEQRVVLRSTVTASEAVAWHAPAIAGVQSVVLQPPSGVPVYLRLIEQPEHPQYKPGTHYGWAALELSVKSADAMYERLLKAGTPIIAPPKALSFTDKLYPMQARGPGGEAIYLNEVRGDLPSSDLPMAQCWVDQLFIAVMGCRDMAASLDFYHALLSTSTGGQWEMPYSVINAAFELPTTTAHKLATVADKRTVLFEVDQYPVVATARPQLKNGLPQGVAMIGVRLSAPPPANKVHWLLEPVRRDVAPYFGAMVGVVRGPDLELVELIWP
jgi:catechol 2,3-dioxygenase-like lactoylglutathione lyase family enzyme